MRYLTMIIVLAVATWLVFLLVVNLDGLTAVLTLHLGIPIKPLGALAMPVWLAFLAVFSAGFLGAVILDLVAWYEYHRMIALQRKQIRLLQDALSNPGALKPAP